MYNDVDSGFRKLCSPRYFPPKYNIVYINPNEIGNFTFGIYTDIKCSCYCTVNVYILMNSSMSETNYGK